MSLIIQGLGFSYGEKTILKDISFLVAPGEVLGIAGSNGAGKSTLLKCMNRLLAPNQGSVCLGERDLARLSVRQRAQLISYIPQNLVASPGLTVYQSVLQGRVPYFRWQPGPRDHQRVMESLKLMGLEALAHRSFCTLSGGERQRSLIARSLCQEAEVLLLDEMTNNLDLRHQISGLDILHERTQHRKLMTLLILHDLNLASLYCDRILLLAQGQIQALGPPSEVLTEVHLETAFHHKPLILRHHQRTSVLPRKGAPSPSPDSRPLGIR